MNPPSADTVRGTARDARCGGCATGGASDRRVIEVNHRNNAFRRRAKELLSCDRGLHHRSNRPIEPEAVFGNIKFNHGFKRFRLKSNEKVKTEFGLIALAHNIRKYIAINECNRAKTNETDAPNCTFLPSAREWKCLSMAC